MAAKEAVLIFIIGGTPFLYKYLRKRFHLGIGGAEADAEKARKLMEEKKDYAKAVKYAEKSLKIFPGSEVANYVLGRCYIEEGDYQKAFQFLDRAKNLSLMVPEYDHLQDRVELNVLNFYHRLANLLKAYSQQENQNRPDILEQIAIMYYEDKHYSDSYFYFNKAFEVSNEAFESVQTFGKACYFLEKYDEAIKYFERAIEIQKTDSEIYQNLASAYFKVGRYNDAIKVLNDLDKDSQTSEIHYQLGRCYFELKDQNQAKEHFQKALNLEPAHSKVREYLKKL